MSATTVLTRESAIADATRMMLGRQVAVAASDPADSAMGLFKVEQAAMTRAVEKRRREFGAGRVAARHAIAELGLPASAIPMGKDRSPVWPFGVVGSITHCDHACVAAVGRSRDFAAIGIDIEPAEPLDKYLLDVVCTSAEISWLGKRATRNPYLMAKLIFSAKECAYKCQYPLSKHAFDFHALDVSMDLQGSKFTAEFNIDTAVFPKGAQLEGQFTIVEGYMLTAMALSTEDVRRARSQARR